MHDSLATSGKCTQTWWSLIAVLSLYMIFGFLLTVERMVPQKGTQAKQCSTVSSKEHITLLKLTNIVFVIVPAFRGKYTWLQIPRQKSRRACLSSGVIETDLHPMFEACAIPHRPFWDNLRGSVLPQQPEVVYKHSCTTKKSSGQLIPVARTLFLFSSDTKNLMRLIWLKDTLLSNINSCDLKFDFKIKLFYQLNCCIVQDIYTCPLCLLNTFGLIAVLWWVGLKSLLSC